MSDMAQEPDNQPLSICDVWKDNLHKVITKMQFQTPLYMQQYVELHTEFLNSIDNLFGTCYLWQKQYFDRLGIDENTIRSYAEFYDKLTEYVLKSMDAYVASQRNHCDVTFEAIKAANTYGRQYMDEFAKAVSFWDAKMNAGNFTKQQPAGK
jgi:hypothetical protein